jgi:methionine-rich copper-binding protein CopC
VGDRRARTSGRSRGRVGRLAALVLLATVVLGGGLAALPRPAAAVTPVASDPQDRQELDDAPGAVTLAFERDVDPGVAKVVVIGPDGQNVTDGPLIVEGTNVTSRLRDDLPEGTYTVHFRIDGSGDEPEGGAYQFSYGPGTFSEPADRSWSGSDAEPAVLRGTNPNASEEPDEPSTSLATPGIEVTSQGPSTDPEPPPASDPASTLDPPPGPATEAGSAPDSSTDPASAPPATATPDDGGGGPWIVGGVLLLVAVVFGALGVWRSRTKGAGDHS